MSQKHDHAAAEPMSPRKLTNFEQVAPGRYVTTNSKQELDRYNAIRKEKKEKQRRIILLDVENIVSE